MQLSRFWADGRERFGLVDGESFIDLSAAIGSFAELAERAQSDTLSSLSGPRFATADVTRLIPLTGHYRVFCAALNYRAHAAEVGQGIPKDPLIFFKLPESMLNPDAVVVTPAVTKFLDYEGELAVVIGKSGRDIPEASALDHVLGYTVMNEMSARDLQKRENNGRVTLDWFSGKALDAFAPVGPYIVTRDSVGNAADLQLSTWVNGTRVQNTRTSDLIFPVPRLISYISQRVMLKPFDVIATGTPGGVGETLGRRLEPGDLVEVTVSGVGTLRNRIGAA
jgi:2-keto-4-pentenoate hydratase/2-oxohepta-3-ene-1,7-dioic acid hydratase in catechol pathway